MTAWFRITEIYVASDGERTRLIVSVCPTDGRYETAERLATDYFRDFGRRVVESAKAAGSWPLPSDHPNAGPDAKPRERA